VSRFPVAVWVGVGVGEGLKVAVGVAVAGWVGVGVTVGVDVPATVAVGVKIGVEVEVGAPVGVGMNVAVGPGPPPVSMMSCGAFAPDWRLARLMAVLLLVVTARLKVPFPVMNEVTSIVFQVFALTDPEEPRTLPTAGALLKLMVDSVQVLFVTPQASMPRL
jgi:hypothetical protein